MIRVKIVVFIVLALTLICLASSCSDSPTPPVVKIVAAPQLTPGGGTFGSAQMVSISCATEGALIRYTRDGSEPTESSRLYSTPLVVNLTGMIKARAFLEGWTPSATAGAGFTIYEKVAAPEFSSSGGVFSSIQTVSLSCATDGAEIRYTTDGRKPTINSALYSAPLTILNSTTILAVAFKENCIPSSTSSITYQINYKPIQMIAVSGGSYIMGNRQSDYYSNEVPTHNVNLNPFYIGKYELTQGEYAAVMGSNPASVYGVGENYPVYNVSWYEALKFCNLRSKAEGLEPVYMINDSYDPAEWGSVPELNNDLWNSVTCNWAAGGYRLPTEAEWEYAARGASNEPDLIYSGSNMINGVAWYSLNDTNGGYPTGTKPVGVKVMNGIGTHDMSGNVTEWCWDRFSDVYYSISPGNNPHGPASGDKRTTRNSAWNGWSGGCRVTYRYGSFPDFKSFSTGFRVCRSGL